MKVGIIGSGIVGQTLAKAFIAEGHQVMLGTRDTSKEEVIQFVKANPQIQAGSFRDSASFGEWLILATGGSVTFNAIELAGKENFAKKLVIDATNPIEKAPPEQGVLKFLRT